ncbi:MAG: glycosyltransferase [Muribaculaceae bacterium]|nr:glycosyltransferase [Muribaculaceae bacterium]
MNHVKLQILVATFKKEGLERLATVNLPEINDVEYIISCQNPLGNEIGIPDSLLRPDIKIYFSNTKGLSRNRNILLQLASAPLCLIADDDLVFLPEGLKKLIETFDNNPDLDIATFKYSIPGGGTEKEYPTYPFYLDKPAKGYYLTSFEIAFRREAVKKTGVLFNENFGIGAPLYGCGEEDIWMASLLKKKLKGMFFPIFIAQHQGETTGIRNAAKPEVLRAQGLIIRNFYPLSSFPRIFLKAYRTSKATGTGILFCIKHLFSGWIKKIKL